MTVNKKYINWAKEFVLQKEGTKKISVFDFYKKDFIKSLKIEKEFTVGGNSDCEKQLIQIVVIPKGIRISEMGFGGGLFAQPWFIKGDSSRVFVYEEYMDFVKENPEFEETNLQMLVHEIGHMVAMSDGFRKEFDSSLSENMDMREVENQKAWIERLGIGDLEIAGATLKDIMAACIENVHLNGQSYMNLREHLANYNVTRFIKFHQKEPLFFNMMEENCGKLAQLIFLSMDDKVLASFGISSSMINNDDLWENCKEAFGPITESYIAWSKLPISEEEPKPLI